MAFLTRNNAAQRFLVGKLLGGSRSLWESLFPPTAALWRNNKLVMSGEWHAAFTLDCGVASLCYRYRV
jgi:hypothetical protein